jgi:cell division transport system permease protein
VLALFVVANTVNLVIAARRDELEITRLVGATDGWILGPFLVEGAFQGLFGAGVALAATWGVHRVVADRLGDSLTIAFGTSHLQFLPPQWITLLVVAGLVLGVGAPWAAVSRFLRRLR